MRTGCDGITLHPGDAAGEVLTLDAPLSLWGGTDVATGVITDAHHPQHGVPLAGRVVVMTAGRGSSSSSSVLAEQIRAGVAPAAFLLAEPDAIIALGAIVAAELYGIHMPVVLLDAADHAALPRCGWAEVTAGEHTADIAVPGIAVPGEGGRLPGVPGSGEHERLPGGGR